MTLMIDRLDFKRWHHGALAGVEEYAVEVGNPQDILGAHTPAFEITNVADLCYRMDLFTRDDNGIVLTAEKFPNVGPPFRSYWMEWRCPKTLDPYMTIGRFGVWSIITADTDDEKWVLICAVFINEKRPRVVARFRFEVSKAGVITDPGPLSVFPEAIEFIMPRSHDVYDVGVARGKAEGETLVRQVEHAAALFPERDRRPFIESQRAALLRSAERAEAEVRALEQRLADQIGNSMRIGVLPPLLMAHSLLGCKNVGTEDHVPDARLSKAHVKRHGEPLVRFKTLTVRPMGGGRGSGERVELGGGQTSLHLVRGHFKTFTAERPLFGSIVGTYWWDQSARGNAEVGTVVKDYSLDLSKNP